MSPRSIAVATSTLVLALVVLLQALGIDSPMNKMVEEFRQWFRSMEKPTWRDFIDYAIERYLERIPPPPGAKNAPRN